MSTAQERIATRVQAAQEQKDDAATRREKDRLRKQAERAKKRAITKATTSQEFSHTALWEANRAKLEPEQLHAYQERESAVMELIGTVRGYVLGIYEILDDDDRGWLNDA